MSTPLGPALCDECELHVILRDKAGSEQSIHGRGCPEEDPLTLTNGLSFYRTDEIKGDEHGIPCRVYEERSADA